MDIRIKELIDFAKIKFGLDNYYLQRHSLNRNVNVLNETVYTLSMEWFPNEVSEQEDDDTNPEGTAVIEIDVNSRKLESVIFVMGKSIANDGVTFAALNTEDIIKWIEDETGLTYGKQFQLEKEEEGKMYFKECFNGVATSPSGYIEVHFDQEGNLTFFSVHGHYPSKTLVNEETYTISLEKVEHLAKEQLKLIEFPSYEKNRLFPVYVMEEIYVMNDQTSTIPFQFIVNVCSQTDVDRTIYWNEPINKPFERKEINWIENVTPEQAFSNEASPDSFPITMVEKEKCVIAVKNFLRQEFTNDTGKWILKTLHRDKGYIHATLRANHQDNRLFERKLLVMIDAKSFQVLNYMDSKPMLEIFDQFQAPEKVTINKEAAYEKIKDFIFLKPYYVYDFEQNQYVLCGKLDCHYGVNAGSGEIVTIDDL
jgi:hypothetical protein